MVDLILLMSCFLNGWYNSFPLTSFLCLYSIQLQPGDILQDHIARPTHLDLLTPAWLEFALPFSWGTQRQRSQISFCWCNSYMLTASLYGNAFSVESISLNKNVWVSIRMTLEFVHKGPINNIAALVQIMAWRRLSDKTLSEPMMVSSLTHICVIRPQWINVSVNFPGLLCRMFCCSVWWFRSRLTLHVLNLFDKIWTMR